MNEINAQVGDEFLNWLSYKPTRGDDELLNLLVLDLIEEISVDPKLVEHQPLQQQTMTNIRVSQKQKTTALSAQSKSQQHRHHSKLLERPILIKQPKLSNQSSLINIMTPGTSKSPTICDTYYDLLKSIHLQITIKPINVNVFMNDVLNSTNQRLELNIPQIDIKSSGTKCDLEEELVSSKLVELPCTFLRACEKTSNKLPWLVEFRNLNVHITSKHEEKEFLVSNLDSNLIFAVKPKYHQYDNLLSSLSFYLSIEMAKNCDLSLRKSQLGFILLLTSKLSATFGDFVYQIDYTDLDMKYNVNSNRFKFYLNFICLDLNVFL